jgi:hypothetical protein
MMQGHARFRMVLTMNSSKETRNHDDRPDSTLTSSPRPERL